MKENMRHSPKFLADLGEVYAALRPQLLSVVFLSDLKHIYDTLSLTLDDNFRSVVDQGVTGGRSGRLAPNDNLRFLAGRFDEWRRRTKESVRTYLAELDKDDPLICPISLFRTMDYGRLETAHTRTLTWLLDPKGEHDFGTTLLAALLRRISGHDCSNGIHVEGVEGEYAIDNSTAKGRLDVLAQGTWKDEEQSGWILVIEAKVDATEGEGQLLKYEEWLRANAAGREIYRIFLTADDRDPETDAEEWESLSFLELVRIFRSVYGELRNTPGFHFLRFYLAGILQDVCGWPRNITDDVANPYAINSYLKTVHKSVSEGANDDAAR